MATVAYPNVARRAPRAAVGLSIPNENPEQLKKIKTMNMQQPRKVLGQLENQQPQQIYIKKNAPELTVAQKETAPIVEPVVKLPVIEEKGKVEIEEVEMEEEDDMDIELDLNNLSLTDVDAADYKEPHFAIEYIHEIIAYLRKKEVADRICDNFMEKQFDLKPAYRDLLVSWMSEIAIKFKLLSETECLAVWMLDKFLSVRLVSKTKLQLVGVTCLFTAAKFEETLPPPPQDYILMTDQTYQVDEMLKMERVVLKALDFNLATPLSLHFLRRFSKGARSDTKTHTLSKYLVELSLHHHSMVKFLPSEVAAAAILLARHMRGFSPLWNSNCRHYTLYKQDQIIACTRTLNGILLEEKNSQRPRAVTQKYASKMLLQVARIPYVPI